MKKTIAQRLGIKKFPFEVRNEKGNLIYYEDSTGVKLDERKNKNEVSFEEIAREFNIPVNELRITK